MKAFSIFLIGLTLIGATVFAAAKSVKFKAFTKTGQEQEYAEARKAIEVLNAEVAEDQAPQVFIQEKVFDFGRMRVGEPGRREFTIENRGQSPLAVSDMGTSCGCLENDFGVFQLAPQESKTITLTWTPFERDAAFSKVQTIATNDPQHKEIQLVIHGEVMTTLDATPNRIHLDRIIAGMQTHSSFTIYSESWERIQVERIELDSALGTCTLVKTLPKDDREQLPARAEFDIDFQPIAETTQSVVRVFVKPPASEIEAYANATTDSKYISDLNWQDDQTVMVELPIRLATIRQLSIYAPFLKVPQGAENLYIANSYGAKLELGKVLHSQSVQKSWSIIGKLRGENRPQDIQVSLNGIENLSAEIEIQRDEKGGIGNAFSISLKAAEPIPVGVYDREASGTLRIEAPGLVGEEVMELPVTLDVISDTFKR
ncbi:MAG: DUF1573 domain-containing protein [Pirellulaceae bacterium]